MIDESITVHDQHQFEIKLGYRLHKESKTTAYGLDAYLYLPYSLGINRATYTKAQFYNDMQAYIRLMSPEASLGTIVNGEASPLSTLRAATEALAAGATAETTARYEAEIKLFGCVVKSALHDYVEFTQKTLINEDRRRLMADYLDCAGRILTCYRELRQLVQIPSVSGRLQSVFDFGDEYLSLLFEDHTYLLLESVVSADPVFFGGFRGKLIDLIEQELSYRRQRHYQSIPDEKSDNEKLVFRKSVLKKYMSSVLFLSTRTEQAGAMMEQVVFGVAAGLAMIFATAVAFVTQSVYGSLTLPFFLALVISYIFKDRLKDLLRLYLSRRVASRLFDHHMHIYSSAGEDVGVCRESFEFVPERKIPPEIARMRSRDHITEIENGWVGEKVILYRKRILLYKDRILRLFRHHNIEGINDIMRFSVLEFIRKMDNPTKNLYVLEEDAYQRIKGDRVYHLNLLLRYALPRKTVYKRFRIVLNRKRIKRIEPVTVEEIAAG